MNNEIKKKYQKDLKKSKFDVEFIDILEDYGFKCIDELEKQLDHQKSMWQELKEWLKKAILRNKDNIISKNDYENVLVIMQELEGEDEQD